MTLPLDGIRVLALEQYGAGPYGTAHLADLGAEVIKIENRKTGGDMARSVGPYLLGENDSEFFQAFNKNKRSLSLDLTHPEGRGVFHRLVETADALLGNLRGDLPERLEVTYEDLKSYNSRIVAVHLSGYGRDSDRKRWPGYDYLMQAEAGFMWLTGEPEAPPTRVGLSMVDFMAGTTAAMALVSGVLQARTTGRGRDMDVSLLDVAMHQLSYPAVWYLNEGLETDRAPRSGHPYIAPSQLYKTKDGWIFLMCQTHRFWELLCDEIGRPELKDAPDFKGYEERRSNRDKLTEVLDSALSVRTTEEWMEAFAGKIPAAPVRTMAEALDAPHFRNRGGVVEVDHQNKPGLKLMNGPVRLDEPLPARPGPKLGADTDSILDELGYDADAIASLRANDVI